MLDVSVVLPTRSRRDMTLAAVRSALRQTHPPREVIVVDDGSRDGTADALEALGEPKIRVIRQDRAGPAEARNNGVAHARGEWIAFLDSDDLWLPRKLERQAVLVAADPTPALVFADSVIVDATREFDPNNTVFSHQPPSSGDIFRDLLLDNFIPTSTVLARRETLRQFPFRSRFSPAEDYNLWLRLARAGRAIFSPAPLAIYRRHAGQIGADWSVMFPKCIEAIEAALKDATCKADEIAGLSTRLWRLHRVSALLLLRQGRVDEAERHIAEILDIYPVDLPMRIRRFRRVRAIKGATR